MNSAKKELLMKALLENPTVREAAKQARVSYTSAFRILREPEFADEYNQRKRAIVDEAHSYLRSQQVEAAKVLIAVMSAESTPAQTRYNTAKAVLELDIRNIEREEIAARISEIERKIGKR